MEEHEDDQYCFQNSFRNSSCKRSSLSTSAYITVYIIFSLISVVTVFLNLLVIISISHFKQLHTPTNLLILSLAVSDLLVGLIVIPSMTVAIMESCWVLGDCFCALLLYTNFLSCSSSVGNLVLISIDRYVAVCDPLLYPLKITIARMNDNLTSLIMTFLPLVNSFINPIIYAFFYSWFKVTTKQMFTLQFRRK
ncbi:trace amine-associated receptor 8a-like [Esox lucius]|uniref:trace amine-associated receptor 8a-like n=1 Tax=Esox lucius TaxID=8010 RepID=UPI0014775908|nr:trace amine-associated receptor 8a-like [Esox lucius]